MNLSNWIFFFNEKLCTYFELLILFLTAICLVTRMKTIVVSSNNCLLNPLAARAGTGIKKEKMSMPMIGNLKNNERIRRVTRRGLGML